MLVAFSVNDICNLGCGFCYVEHAGKLRSEATIASIDAVLELGAENYAVIGKEPFLSPAALQHIVQRTNASATRISIITNGIAMASVFEQWDAKGEIGDIDAIDLTYHVGDDPLYRRHFDKVLRGAHIARERVARLSVLFVLHQGTAEHLDGAVAFAERVKADHCIISPLSKPVRSAEYEDAFTPPEFASFFRALGSNQSFMRSPITCTVVDDYQFLLGGKAPMKAEHVLTLADDCGLPREKVYSIGDPFSLDTCGLLDVDVLGREPVAVHPMWRLNNDSTFRHGLPTVPVVGLTAAEVHEQLAEAYRDVDFLGRIRAC